MEAKNANKPIFIGQLIPGKFEPFPKNPNLAQVFTQIGRSEELGTGVKNVYKYSKAYSGSDEITFEENDVFIACIPLNKSKDGENITDKVTDKVTDNQQLILKAILQNNRVSTNELAETTGISQRKIKENIAKLKLAGLLKRKGKPKNGFWEVLNL